MKILFAVLLAFGLTACEPEPGSENAPSNGGGGQSGTPVADYKVAQPTVHDAMCGCQLEVGTCGNYIKVEGQFVPLEWSELGHMEWCGNGPKGAKIEVTGAMQGGKFVAESYKPVQ